MYICLYAKVLCEKKKKQTSQQQCKALPISFPGYQPCTN